jgi:alpha-D-xyloside xylohydrolase
VNLTQTWLPGQKSVLIHTEAILPNMIREILQTIASFTLYEDEGTNYNYEKEAYAIIPVSYKESTGELIVSDRQCEFQGMLKERTFKVVWVSKNKPEGCSPDKKPAITIKYSDQKMVVKK